MLNGERVNAFTLTLRIRQGCPFLITSIQHFTGSFNPFNKARERNKGIQIGHKRLKLSL